MRRLGTAGSEKLGGRSLSLAYRFDTASVLSPLSHPPRDDSSTRAAKNSIANSHAPLIPLPLRCIN